MKIIAGLAAAMLAALGACTASHHSATLPSLSGAAGTSGSGHSASQVAARHAAAQCVRTHGVPSYQDPVVTADGHVYTDMRSLHRLSAAQFASLHQACGSQLTAAGFVLRDEPPAPPQLVQAGVRSAECMRAHGLPNVQDPTAQSDYTPGHGFGYTSNEVPSGGKANPVFQAAAHACRSLLDAEIRASTLTSLGNDG